MMHLFTLTLSYSDTYRDPSIKAGFWSYPIPIAHVYYSHHERCHNTPTIRLGLQNLMLLWRNFLLCFSLRILTVYVKVSHKPLARAKRCAKHYFPQLISATSISRHLAITDSSTNFKATEYTARDHKVPVDGGEILVRSVVPTPNEGEDGTYPLLVWYHGGGA